MTIETMHFQKVRFLIYQSFKTTSIVDRRDTTTLKFLRDYEGVLSEHNAQNSNQNNLEKPFMWFDAFEKKSCLPCCSGSKTNSTSLEFELVCVRWNIASLLAYLGGKALENEPTDEQLKQSVSYFQEAAGIFSALRAFGSIFRVENATNDMEDETLAALEKYCLSGAQAAYMVKITSNQTKAKLAHGAYHLLTAVSGDCPISIIDDARHKSKFFLSNAHFYQGKHDAEEAKHGLVVARYKKALDISESIKNVSLVKLFFVEINIILAECVLH